MDFLEILKGFLMIFQVFEIIAPKGLLCRESKKSDVHPLVTSVCPSVRPSVRPSAQKWVQNIHENGSFE